ncbi:hypothetical protein [Sphingobium sp. WCS2017Hpa-17]|uniref:hypothetical protein n=1 Tax=Sphingobium sp. WCS2017Hpa-17 TaxID=3073638 RepID=UPI00288B4D7D|nr:hypothetical protein [Sphingobium sp. WCS2017Hpa-17]
MIACELDDPDGIIFVHATGLWSIADVDRHYTHLGLIIADRRRNGLPIRILSDVTEAQRQARETEARILEHMERTYLPTDRVAILVADVADKMYVRARLGKAIVGVFSSQLPAEMWLMTDDLQPPGIAAA